jgi:excisionase family DNA binding protein
MEVVHQRVMDWRLRREVVSPRCRACGSRRRTPCVTLEMVRVRRLKRRYVQHNWYFRVAASAVGRIDVAGGVKRSLTVREAAFLLQVGEMKARRMIDCGVIRSVGDGRTADGRKRQWVDPVSVRELFPEDACDGLRRVVLGAILSGRFVVPAPSTRWAPPRPLSVAVDELSARVFGDATTDRTSIARTPPDTWIGGSSDGQLWR